MKPAMPLRSFSRRRRHFLQGGLAAAAVPFVADVFAQTAAKPSELLADPFFAELERRTFFYFWETTDASTGLAPDRWPSSKLISIAAVGFALTAYPIGVSRGWITRQQAAQRVRTTLRWFLDAPQGAGPHGNAGYKGFYYHYLDPQTGLRHGDSELSTVDTAILVMGALYCREWFDGAGALEAEVRQLADQLYANVDWDWARNGGKGIPYSWHPMTGHDPINWSGLDEGMFIYMLAIGSPAHPIPGSCWQEWTHTYEQKFDGWRGSYGPPHLQGAPLFCYQYPQVWVDMRGMRDAYMRGRGIDYFENARRAVLAQQAYAIANPQQWTGYGATMWGFTACDGPANAKQSVAGRDRTFYGYQGRALARFDDGTLSPPAVAAALPFAPEIVVPTLKAMHERYGDLVFAQYGFVDAFNPSFDLDVKLDFGRRVSGRGWFDTDYIAIDQGPILAMFANYRDEGVWSKLRKADWLRKGLSGAGFKGGWLQA
jgi:hypothetical protein